MILTEPNCTLKSVVQKLFHKLSSWKVGGVKSPPPSHFWWTEILIDRACVTDIGSWGLARALLVVSIKESTLEVDFDV